MTKSKRSFLCNKKIPLLFDDVTCKCGHSFCLTHRLPEMHNCSFDFKKTE